MSESRSYIHNVQGAAPNLNPPLIVIHPPDDKPQSETNRAHCPPDFKNILGGSSAFLIDQNMSEGKEENFSTPSIRLELQLTVFVFACFLVAIVVPLSMVIIGAMYVTRCPSDQMIPIFLIVCGCSFLMSIFGLRKLAGTNEADFNRHCFQFTLWTSVVFQITWFVAGCVWIYKAYEPDFTLEDSPDYCHQTLYRYSFWLINGLFIAVGLIILIFSIFVFCAKQKKEEKEYVTSV